MKKRCLMIGAGGMAKLWLEEFWPAFFDQVEIVALVDVSAAALQAGGDVLGLPDSRRFAQMSDAFATVEADFCCIVTPPAFHADAVKLACERGLDILSEKPIADTWEACCEVYRAVENAGVKMLVTQNYRYTPRILALKKAVAELGVINYAVSRYASDWRVRTHDWYIRRAPHPILVDCAVHHFDQLRNLCAADCLSVSGYSWNPGGVRGAHSRFQGSDGFEGDACALFTLRMNNGSFAQYEGTNIAAASTNSWHREFYRLECEGGAAVLGEDNIVRIETRDATGGTSIREISQDDLQWHGHQAIIAQFLQWLNGGAAPATVLRDNIRSNALMFGALEASRSGTTIDVGKMVEKVMQSSV